MVNKGQLWPPGSSSDTAIPWKQKNNYQEIITFDIMVKLQNQNFKQIIDSETLI